MLNNCMVSLSWLRDHLRTHAVRARPNILIVQGHAIAIAGPKWTNLITRYVCSTPFSSIYTLVDRDPENGTIHPGLQI